MELPQQFKDELKRRVSLSSIIGKHVKLVKKSSSFVGLCPFHKEKTPSFHVHDDKGFYHCFGCKASGDVFSFLTDHEKMPFMDAVQYLANLAGMRVPESQTITPEERAARASISAMLEAAATYFQQKLTEDSGGAARDYLTKRQVSPESQSKYRLGYAPKAGLIAHLEAKGYKIDDMIRGGLAGRSEHGESIYEFFRHRLMFPILDARGAVVAFGGRALASGQEPKYLNSADSPVFHKKMILYGLNEARARIKEGLPVIVAEGYMDVIAIDQHQVAGAVAPLGTALTEEQILLLWKSIDTPYLCFDGDVAGQRAALHTLIRLLPVLMPGKSVRVMELPHAQDPDDVLQAGGAAALRQLAEASVPFIDALWHNVALEFDLNLPEQKAKFWQTMREHIRQINHPAMRDSIGDEIHTRISAMQTQRWGRTSGRFSGRFSGQFSGQFITKHHAKPIKNMRPRIMMSILLHQPECIHDICEDLMQLNIKDTLVKKMLNIIVDSATMESALDAETFRTHLMQAGVAEEDLIGLNESVNGRIRFDPAQITSDDAKARLAELITLEARSSKSKARKLKTAQTMTDDETA